MSGPTTPRSFRPTVAEVDLGAIRHNVARLRPPGVELMAVVKADAYGHGAAPVARAALEAGATWLAVALVEEGIALRDEGIAAPILVLSEVPRGAERDALGAGLVPTVASHDGVSSIAAAARALDLHAPVHLKIDTGMHRVGVWPPEDAPELARAVVDGGLHLDGVFTHLATAESDLAFAEVQLERFRSAVAAIEARGIRPHLRHAANSAATIAHPAAHLDLVRTGIAMYGLPAGPGLDAGLRPALRLRSRVASVRRLDAGEALSYGQTYRLHGAATIATVPIGYADGFPRPASPGAEALIGGRRFPIAGRVTMDMLLVDCGDAPVAEGDEVVLIGEQGGERIDAERLAVLTGTIPYEIVTRLGPRIPREHRG